MTIRTIITIRTVQAPAGKPYRVESTTAGETVISLVTPPPIWSAEGLVVWSLTPDALEGVGCHTHGRGETEADAIARMTPPAGRERLMANALLTGHPC